MDAVGREQEVTEEVEIGIKVEAWALGRAGTLPHRSTDSQKVASVACGRGWVAEICKQFD